MRDRFIDIPGQLREPSAELLQRLRAIDPYADVVYVGGGHWLLGRVHPVDYSRSSVCRMGRRWVAHIREGDGFFAASEIEDLDADRLARFRALQHALLRAQGFEILKDVVVHGQPDAVLEYELRRIRYLEQHHLEELTPEEQQAESDRRSQRNDRRLYERELASRIFHRSPYGRGNPAPVSLAS